MNAILYGGGPMNVINNRRSIRKYKNIPVNQDDLNIILQAGLLAPSAKHRQPWKYYVYTGKAKEQILSCMEHGLHREEGEEAVLPTFRYCLPDAFNTLRIMNEAPVLIMIENTNGSSPYEPIDVAQRITEISDSLAIGASVENILLAATELGYGTLWIANTCFAYPELVDYMNLKGQLVGAIALGVPDAVPYQKQCKPFDMVVEFKD